MKDLLMTRDGRYVYGLDRVVDVETGLYIDMDNPNPIFICEMFKNESLFIYKHSLIESTELFTNIRKLLYRLMESDMNVIMEYEIKFGRNLIIESNKSLLTEQIISDSWDFVKNKIIQKYPTLLEGWVEDKWNQAKAAASGAWDKTKEVAGKAWDKTKEVAGKAWEGVKDAGAWALSKGIPWIMEKVEEFMMSPVGIGLDVALTALGIGKLATGTIWGIIFIWKVYKLVTGQSKSDNVWTYIELAACLVGVLFSGAAKGMKSAFKAVGGNVSKVSGKILQPILTMISKGVGGVMNLMIKPLEWITKFLGPKASGMISTFKSRVGDILKKMENVFKPKPGAVTSPGFRETVKKGIRKDITDPAKAAWAGKGPVTVTSAAKKGVVHGLAWHGGFKALESGIGSYADYKKGQTQKEVSAVEDQIAQTMAAKVDDDVTNIVNQYSK